VLDFDQTRDGSQVIVTHINDVEVSPPSRRRLPASGVDVDVTFTVAKKVRAAGPAPAKGASQS
jgi:hypothetical protein